MQSFARATFPVIRYLGQSHCTYNAHEATWVHTQDHLYVHKCAYTFMRKLKTLQKETIRSGPTRARPATHYSSLHLYLVHSNAILSVFTIRLTWQLFLTRPFVSLDTGLLAMVYTLTLYQPYFAMQ